MSVITPSSAQAMLKQRRSLDSVHQQTVARLFRLKLSRAAPHGIYTIGCLCNHSCRVLFWEVQRACLRRAFSKWSGPRKALKGNEGLGSAHLVPQAHRVGSSLHKPVPWAPLAPHFCRGICPSCSMLRLSVCLSSDLLASHLRLRVIYRSNREMCTGGRD